LGWHSVRNFLLLRDIGASISKWTIHTTTSSYLAHCFWNVSAVFDVPPVSHVSKLQINYGHILLVRSAIGKLSHQHGQGVWSELLDYYRAKIV
jgi:hypothetical protein